MRESGSKLPFLTLRHSRLTLASKVACSLALLVPATGYRPLATGYWLLATDIETSQLLTYFYEHLTRRLPKRRMLRPHIALDSEV